MTRQRLKKVDIRRSPEVVLEKLSRQRTVEATAVIEGERPLLDSMIASLMARPTAKITVHGYANVDGAIDYNRTVSEGCANAVKAYMVGQGVDASRIRVLGNGTKGFAATERPQIKRRVEIVFDPPR